MHLKDIDTPALLVDLDRLEDNLVRMKNLAENNNVHLRPHTKTHKSPEIAKMQIEKGANGITCAKISEAEIMAEAGLDDILIANEIIGAIKHRRLIDLAENIKLCVAVDSLFGIQTLAAAFSAAERQIEVVIEINCGQDRCGVAPGPQVLELAVEIQRQRGLQLRGLMSHGGHAYNQNGQAEIEKVGLAESNTIVDLAELLRSNDIEVNTLSVGSSPAAQYCAAVPGITEIRPGTYVFNDRTQVALQACATENCALSVLATVMSKPTASRAVIDAGRKVLTSDMARPGEGAGFGWVVEKNSTVTRLSEEHGMIDADAKFEIGEKVNVIPNHVCVVVNMLNKIYGVRNGNVEHIFEVAGRGAVT